MPPCILPCSGPDVIAWRTCLSEIQHDRWYCSQGGGMGQARCMVCTLLLPGQGRLRDVRCQRLGHCSLPPEQHAPGLRNRPCCRLARRRSEFDLTAASHGMHTLVLVPAICIVPPATYIPPQEPPLCADDSPWGEAAPLMALKVAHPAMHGLLTALHSMHSCIVQCKLSLEKCVAGLGIGPVHTWLELG